jgi:ABC transporter with metal-binding/Fe-S-binding domain ATP-binding protein
LKVGTLFSGGKDSTFSSFLATQRDSLECMITLSPKRPDSYMFHYPNVRWTSLQAEAMGVPQVMQETEGIKEAELEDLKEAVTTAKARFGIEGVYSGALASVYQKSRVDRICDEVGVRSISPLWGVDPERHLRNLLEAKFEVVITSVSALGLDESWLGRRIDSKVIDELVKLHSKYGLHIGLEGGEGETYVTDCPIFGKRIVIQESERVWNGDSGYLRITRARLVSK